MTVIVGDCVETMATMPEASVDAIVCDPPYGLEFMGVAWDTLGKGGPRGDADFDVPGSREHARTAGAQQRVRSKANRNMQRFHEAWAREALRVLKPGGMLLAFGGTRTYHRLACAVEDAGFEIRDSLCWLYGSGFPKSHDVSKAIDKAAGVEREVVGTSPRHAGRAFSEDKGWNSNALADADVPATAPATPDAERWSGFGTALKPAHEPIVMARKPLTGTVAANVLEHGTGALNVDGCRIGTEGGTTRSGQAPYPRSADGREDRSGSWARTGHAVAPVAAGRWPANVVLSHTEDCEQAGVRRVKTGTAVQGRRDPSELASDAGWGYRKQVENRGHADADGGETVAAWVCSPECPVRMLDEQTGERPAGYRANPSRTSENGRVTLGAFADGHERGERGYRDSGGASRFFYCAKASSRERNAGLDEFEAVERANGNKWTDQDYRVERGERSAGRESGPRRNAHPTVKPIKLMRWLVRLVTPPGGTVLDPFAGSGTTGCAAELEGFEFIGVERDPEYAAIARARIAHWQTEAKAAERVAA